VILLTDEESDNYLGENLDLLLKAQARKVVEWGNQRCDKHMGINHDIPRHRCFECWNELKGEIDNSVGIP